MTIHIKFLSLLTMLYPGCPWFSIRIFLSFMNILPFMTWPDADIIMSAENSKADAIPKRNIVNIATLNKTILFFMNILLKCVCLIRTYFYGKDYRKQSCMSIILK